LKNKYVSDTMAIILWLEKRKLPAIVSGIFKSVENGDIELHIPAITLAEIGYLFERKRIDTSIHTVLNFCEHNKNVIIEPMSVSVIVKTFQITDIPELHDRIIAASASSLNCSLITNDPKISQSKFVTVVW
jgi:PIN domain nuclease of toxin-antitoxin system